VRLGNVRVATYTEKTDLQGIWREVSGFSPYLVGTSDFLICGH